MKFRNKFGARKTGDFPSKLEAAVYEILQLREKLGEIESIERQQTVVLQDGPREVRITWRLDFSYILSETKEKVYVEAKGFPTNEYKLKLKIWRKNPPAILEIYTGSYKYPKLTERITLA